jgi:hypothetical protein
MTVAGAKEPNGPSGLATASLVTMQRGSPLGRSGTFGERRGGWVRTWPR